MRMRWLPVVLAAAVGAFSVSRAGKPGNEPEDRWIKLLDGFHVVRTETLFENAAGDQVTLIDARDANRELTALEIVHNGRRYDLMKDSAGIGAIQGPTVRTVFWTDKDIFLLVAGYSHQSCPATDRPFHADGHVLAVEIATGETRWICDALSALPALPHEYPIPPPPPAEPPPG